MGDSGLEGCVCRGRGIVLSMVLMQLGASLGSSEVHAVLTNAW